jgi:hypothetical protein
MSDLSTLSSLPEEDAALLETLSPEFARLLYPEQSTEPFTVTAQYPHFGGTAGDTARRLEAAATRHVVVDTGTEAPLHQTTFSLRQVEEFHELYHLAEAAIGVDNIDLLLNGKVVPLTRELWLPLLWSLRK